MEKKQPSIGFSLKKIITEQFAVLADAYQQGKDADMTTQISFAMNHDTRLLGVKTQIQFKHIKTTFLLVEVSCHFEITSESWESLRTDNMLVFPKGFIQHLSMITVGTVRGVLHAKTENTDFNKFIIPTLNLTEILKDDLVFDLNNPEI